MLKETKIIEAKTLVITEITCVFAAKTDVLASFASLTAHHMVNNRGRTFWL